MLVESNKNTIIIKVECVLDKRIFTPFPDKEYQVLMHKISGH